MRQAMKYLQAGVMGALMLGAMAAVADDKYPNRPVQLIVPYGAGGTIDTVARRLAPKLQAALGQTIVIQNRAGGGTLIGAEAAARAEPDGYTVFLGSNASFTIMPQMVQKVAYDPLRSFAAIGTVTSFPNLILVAPNSPHQTLADVIKAARVPSAKVSYASFGPGSTSQLTGESIKVASGADIVEIAYKSGAESLNAILAGQVTFGFDTALGSAQRVKSGQVRALAATSARRMKQLPDVPTIGEAGFPEGTLGAWVALFVPAKTPQAVQAALGAALQKVLKDPEMEAEFAQMGVEITPADGKETMEMINAEHKRLGSVIQKAKLKAN
jgi:tripartite-type tricarboxylate transporter receptor subunit TctC